MGLSNFRYSLYRNVGLAVKHYNMINENDKILVAFSGGKDSFAMLDSLSRLKTRAPVNFTLFVCVVNPGFPGYAVSPIEEWLAENDYNYHIENSDIYETVFSNPQKSADGCFHCSRQRRSILYRLAEVNGCNKIALGHHLDDFIETVLMSMMYNGRIETMLPVFEAGTKNFRVIRPLIYVSEKTTEKYCVKMGFPAAACGCPENEFKNLKRMKIKNMLLEFEKNDCKIKENLFRSLANFNADYMLDLRYNKKLSSIKYELIDKAKAARRDVS